MTLRRATGVRAVSTMHQNRLKRSVRPRAMIVLVARYCNCCQIVISPGTLCSKDKRASPLRYTSVTGMIVERQYNKCQTEASTVRPLNSVQAAGSLFLFRMPTGKPEILFIH